ncbi:Fe-S-containing hydro-lyase [Helicobacter sp. MIT 14-3879]|uniref:Fe-S-containing hydro-lyase n=1 Tax=Helicobacter sp. MIT 14-3879 TaxID=2040649 RepID=UPI000E1F8AE8|nr:Fe-S-containing hydro-lyase [Helicobacter sp. MIT 14-3879]RDU63974.1 Fe-S-containing hydro-lyase [Helicobacter sp. MIT 14-3879]
MEIRLNAPFNKDDIEKLNAGDNVLISGSIIAARDAAHKKLMEVKDIGGQIPLDLTNQVIYYLGPSPAKPGEIIGAAGPTTSGRMDKYTPMMLDLGISGMIGKGYRNKEVIESIIKHKAVYMVAIGGAGALIAKSIKKYEVLAYPELGPEAIARLEVIDFPAIVAIDSKGVNFYEIGQAKYKK